MPSTPQVAAGVILGVGGALAASGVLRNLLYGVKPMGPLTYAAAAGILLTRGAASCVMPAWRAASADALTALRSE